ncbi:EF hand [Oesophagostomum dentatum]|uniref:Glucosidase 2 subunit beta n=1 Tax=Oesophagostomum dentatum TaxID=61180 RepID=A0A0B1T4Y1_OESDE|nr:EF hand [Oesophagostomum dentatum]
MLAAGLILALIVAVSGKERSPDIEALPRGVPYNRAALYKKSAEFACLDGSKRIPYYQVNDDYCDCPDGSDEPGTAACPNGKFHCANKGHTPLDIPSSRVDDKICDCCDGSDEYTGAVNCPNICDELGKSAREEKQRQAEIARKGFANRKVLAAEGKKLRPLPLKEERDKLLPLKEELLKKKDAATAHETELKEKHRKEWDAKVAEKKKEKADKMFKEIDINNDGKITLDEMKKLEYLDADHDGAISDDEAKIFLTGDEVNAEQFLNDTYERLKTEKVAYEDYKKDQEAEEQHKEEDKDDLAEPHDDHITYDDDTGVTTDAPEVTMSTPTLPKLPKLPTRAPDEEDEDGNYGVAQYDDETIKAVKGWSISRLLDLLYQFFCLEADDARREYDEMDVKVSTLDRDIREAESFLEQDFGADYAWASLKGKCFELTEKQYTYKYCPFDKTVQKDKGGYGETSLGHWKEWTGDANNKYAKQKYDNGQQCWNGPARSTDVEIKCGEESELVEATEPAKCEYRFVFRTPAACNDPDHEEPVHAEL